MSKGSYDSKYMDPKYREYAISILDQETRDLLPPVIFKNRLTKIERGDLGEDFLEIRKKLFSRKNRMVSYEKHPELKEAKLKKLVERQKKPKIVTDSNKLSNKEIDKVVELITKPVSQTVSQTISQTPIVTKTRVKKAI